MSEQNPLEDLKEIRKMMENSSKFLSLSGLSGVFAGLVALAGSAWAYWEIHVFENKSYYNFMTNNLDEAYSELDLKLFLIAGLILVFALSGGFFFTWIKARKQGKKLMTPLSFRLMLSLGIPLLFGGLFTLGLYLQGGYLFIAPATLLFYGLALLNGSKYVHVDIRYLALSQMFLSLISIFWLEYSLYLWAFGFGILHILYGTIMYFKYDRNKK